MLITNFEDSFRVLYLGAPELKKFLRNNDPISLADAIEETYSRFDLSYKHLDQKFSKCFLILDYLWELERNDQISLVNLITSNLCAEKLNIVSSIIATEFSYQSPFRSLSSRQNLLF
jgi:hypothetical protein